MHSAAARKTSKGAANRSKPQPPAARLRFVDFSIRAWREGHSIGVMAHSTPVGGMRQPAFVRIGGFDARDWRLRVDADWGQMAALGRELARWVLPPDVWSLLGESLRALGALPGLGVRIRLCLSEELIDLPWEYLYRPDVTDASAPRSGFLLLDERITLVREPPSLIATPARAVRRQRGVFVGTLWDDGTDGWGVVPEFRSLRTSLAKLNDLVEVRSAMANDRAEVERLIDEGCDFFHYAGHIDLHGDRAALVQTVDSTHATAAEMRLLNGHFEAQSDDAEWKWIDQLAPRLKRAGVRYVMLNACNSGFWPAARPFLRAGVACMVGVQGLVSNIAALNFSEKVYRSLAVGLSLDEAVSWARLWVMDEAHSYYPGDWGRFMVYMPAESSVLFPRGTAASGDQRQQETLVARAKTVRQVKTKTAALDAEAFQRQFSDMTEVSVLILGRFTEERKAVLDEIRRSLTKLQRVYVPILFDFEKLGDRDLIESIVRWAASSRFVIADLSDPKSVPAELQAIVPLFPSLPVVPILEETQREYPVSDHILRRESVYKPIVRYRDKTHLASILEAQVIAPAEEMVAALRPPILM